ncbi:hypothetical protein EAH72_32690 [Pseudomonas caspiana]|nr:hypothetical protein EAH72_32690 [Pseudomonas caspiana]
MDGRHVRFASTADALAAVISRMAQELQVFPSPAVHENLFAGGMPLRQLVRGVASVSRSRSLAAANKMTPDFGIRFPLRCDAESLVFAK